MPPVRATTESLEDELDRDASLDAVVKPVLSGKLAEGMACNEDSECQSGSCGLTNDGSRCLGSAQQAAPGMAATDQALNGLVQESDIRVSARKSPRRSAKRLHQTSSRKKGTSTASAHSRDATDAAANDRHSLDLGDNCTSGAPCRPGLSCKGVTGLKTCVPGG